MDLKTISRACLQFSLSICFIVIVAFAIKNLIAQDTGVSIEFEDKDIRLPSITLCQQSIESGMVPRFTSGKNQSLLDFFHSSVNQIENDILSAGIFAFENEYAGYLENSTNANPVIDLNSSKFRTPGVTLSILESGFLISCVTFDPPMKTMKNFSTVTIYASLNMTKYQLILLERHEQGQSNHNFVKRWDVFNNVKKGVHLGLAIAPKKQVFINTQKHPCDEQNTQKKTKCTNNFIQSKLGCRLPWINGTGGKKYGRVCNEPIDLDNYIKLFKELHTDKLKQEVADFGCTRVNCETYSWRYDTVFEQSLETIPQYYQPNVTSIQLTFQNTIPVEVTKQTLVYGFTNFVADFGGYLGLLLGASLLSIFDSVTGLFQRPLKQEQH